MAWLACLHRLTVGIQKARACKQHQEHEQAPMPTDLQEGELPAGAATWQRAQAHAHPRPDVPRPGLDRVQTGVGAAARGAGDESEV